EWQVNVNVRIDKSRKNILARCVDDLRIGASTQIRTDCGNRFAFGINVGDVIVGGSDDTAILNEQWHAMPRNVRQWLLKRFEPSLSIAIEICYTTCERGKLLRQRSAQHAKRQVFR